MLRRLLFVGASTSALIPAFRSPIRSTARSLVANNMPSHLAEAKKMVDTGDAILLDVREPNEWAQSHFSKAVLVPYHSQLADGIIPKALIQSEKTLVIHCAHGIRSQYAARLLADQGLSTICLYESFDELCALEFDDLEFN
mmetsp:Transcript_14976/g.22544  ORF Transcript_14976/g.22544 Transcript_14976/m.22544 type:complete len:141 (-) Transcript_14976:141-563(-)